MVQHRPVEDCSLGSAQIPVKSWCLYLYMIDGDWDCCRISNFSARKLHISAAENALLISVDGHKRLCFQSERGSASDGARAVLRRTGGIRYGRYGQD